MITYKYIKDKDSYLFCNEGVYWSLKIGQVTEMQFLLDEIVTNNSQEIEEDEKHSS